MEDAGGHLAGRPTQTRRRQHLVWNRWRNRVKSGDRRENVRETPPRWDARAGLGEVKRRTF